MPVCAKSLVLLAARAMGWGAEALADKGTVCTITVNSPDEKEMLRRRLPEDRCRFVELVERGRADWLASACQQGIRRDLVVISGHFDGSTEFCSNQVAAGEFLPVAEVERVSCPGLFSRLKEVYLSGCDTSNADIIKGASPEVERSLARAEHSRLEAGNLARTLDRRHAESSRDRTRRIFMDVPAF